MYVCILCLYLCIYVYIAVCTVYLHMFQYTVIYYVPTLNQMPYNTMKKVLLLSPTFYIKENCSAEREVICPVSLSQAMGKAKLDP